MASSQEIKIFPLIDDVETGEDIKFRADLSQVATLTREQLRDMKIHGLFVNKVEDRHVIVALETVDNQIDFNQLFVINRPGGDEEFSYEFKQFREVVPRETKYDEVQKLRVSFTKLFQGYAVALRKSGSADFYFTMARVASYERQQKGLKNAINADRPPGETEEDEEAAEAHDLDALKVRKQKN